jgi:hypothetical protein
MLLTLVLNMLLLNSKCRIMHCMKLTLNDQQKYKLIFDYYLLTIA